MGSIEKIVGSDCTRDSFRGYSESINEIDSNQHEGFDDFTVASSWERLIADVEVACRKWHHAIPKGLLAAGAVLTEGCKQLYQLQAEFLYGFKGYRLTLFYQVDCKDDVAEEWRADMHHLQLWFGVKEFLVITPMSLSGVILDAPEATLLLSAVAIALSNCGSYWPAFAPVHDPTRKAYKGVQCMSGPYSWSFEADRIGSQVPVKLMHLEGLYELFLSKVGFSLPDSASDFNVKVRFTMRLTYVTPVPGFEYIQSDVGSSPRAESVVNYEADVYLKAQWDEQCPWAEWYTIDDPIKGFELTAIWARRLVGDPIEMAEFENVSTFESDKWLLQPLLAKGLNHDQQDEQVSFSSRLLALVTAFSVSKEAQFMEDFAAADKPEIEKFLVSATVPPPGVLDRVLKELFHQGPILSTSQNHLCHQHAKAIKGAPTNSLFAQFCLQALWFGTCNIRAIAVLWIEFVREVRWCWEELQPLSRVSPDQLPDLDTCLVHQKLHLLAACIKRKSAEHNTFSIPGDAGESESETSAMNGTQKEDSEDIFDIANNVAGSVPAKMSYSLARDSNSSIKSDSEIVGSGMDSIVSGKDSMEVHFASECKQQQRGSAGPVDHLMLLKSGQKLHAPMTQEPPIMTEDMMMEREQAIVALSHSPSGKIALSRFQSDILGADMSVFKAANPGSMLEDFIRWHSPQDWIIDDQDEKTKDMLGVTPGHKRHEKLEGSLSTSGRLSKRMSEPGNTWEHIWRNTDAVPASEQKPLFDHTREGEKVIHYLETLRPHHLLSQMVCTAFGATADLLLQTETAKLQPLLVEQDRLYLTIASILRPLRSINISDEELIANMEEWHADFAELCRLFEEVEMHVIVAVSLFQKLPQTHRLLSALFQDYMNSEKQEKKNYTSGASSMDHTRQFCQVVSRSEREGVAATLFPPLSTSETWRKSIRMGNFLNGHEPSLREVIFFHFDDFLQVQRETYRDQNENTRHNLSDRMYIQGTSNDLQVAYSLILND